MLDLRDSYQMSFRNDIDIDNLYKVFERYQDYCGDFSQIDSGIFENLKENLRYTWQSFDLERNEAECMFTVCDWYNASIYHSDDISIDDTVDRVLMNLSI